MNHQFNKQTKHTHILRLRLTDDDALFLQHDTGRQAGLASFVGVVLQVLQLRLQLLHQVPLLQPLRLHQLLVLPLVLKSHRSNK